MTCTSGRVQGEKYMSGRGTCAAVVVAAAAAAAAAAALASAVPLWFCIACPVSSDNGLNLHKSLVGNMQKLVCAAPYAARAGRVEAVANSGSPVSGCMSAATMQGVMRTRA